MVTIPRAGGRCIESAGSSGAVVAVLIALRFTRGPPVRRLADEHGPRCRRRRMRQCQRRRFLLLIGGTLMLPEFAVSAVEQRMNEPTSPAGAAAPAPVVQLPASDISPSGSGSSDPRPLTAPAATPTLDRASPREFLIRGATSHGKPFRPSDWSERLCGVLSSYRPGAQGAGRAAHLGYSPYARPVVIDGLRCVIIDERLRDLELMAFDFALNFARDNDLGVSEVGASPTT